MSRQSVHGFEEFDIQEFLEVKYLAAGGLSN
ncbi:hypothetical protein CUJ84_pRLN2000402 (plasmid) [Rhizobium leguminosarum]|uniref:Uncharacterized protein n=1 Tax=Rhizobium leguminosarum TaxID=384 RepID=A0A2K9ZFF5_RHILE|nr:hypothetical protein CUJ84_pRLN2000402 [Rhizobium leguminosarum]